MISRILKSLMKWYSTRPYSKTLVHFISLCAFSAVFFGLTNMGVFEKAPINVPPVEYQRLDARMTGEQLEQKLRTRSADVKELIFFKGTKAVAVLGAPGFEQEKIIPRIDPDQIRTMAKDANVPTRELDSIKVPNPEGTGLTVVWWILLLAQGGALAYILFSSPREGMPNIIKHLYESIGHSHAAFFHHRKLRRSRLHRAAWIIAMVLLVAAFGSRFFLNQPVSEIPQEYSFHQQSTRWQVERYLKIAPADFQRAAVIDGTSTMYVQILPSVPVEKVEVRKPVAAQPARGVYRGAPPQKSEAELRAEQDAALEQMYSPEGVPIGQPEIAAPVTTNTTGDTATKEITPVSRLLKFSNDAAGQAEMNALIASLTEAKVPVRHIEASLNSNIFTTMPKLWAAIFAIWSVLMVLWGIVIISFWNTWREAEGEKVNKGAIAIGGGSSSAGSDVEVRDEDKKTFADVAGCQEAIDELRVVEKKIRRPKIYKLFGAPVPSGVMMYGPPGTGKTLLARALSGEIGGHFEACSGSQFVEMYVGVGAKRVREMYKRARAAAKRSGRISIVFIDEIDAIAKKRGGGGDSGGDKEYEQTLNELLVQMNGFGNHGLVLTMAATNRLDILDDAILRPGRFDIKVQVPKPDKKGRAQIYGVYLKKLKIVLPEGDNAAMMAKLLDDLARRSHDFSGAEIEGAIKNGATIAVEREFGNVTDDLTDEQLEEYRQKAIITVDDLNLGVDKMAYGTQIKSRVRTDKERKATAIHEIGHACVPTVMGGDPVNRITIVMTDKSLGLMDSSPEEGERYDWTDEQFRIRLRMMLAGRAAEKVLLGKISTGASNDFERASQLARQMVGVYGMSEEFGVKSIPLDRYGFPASNIGDLLKKFNDAWGKIIDDAEAETEKLIRKHEKQIEAAADVLYDNETMTGDEFRQIWKDNENLAKVEESAEVTAAVDSAQA